MNGVREAWFTVTSCTLNIFVLTNLWLVPLKKTQKPKSQTQLYSIPVELATNM